MRRLDASEKRTLTEGIEIIRKKGILGCHGGGL